MKPLLLSFLLLSAFCINETQAQSEQDQIQKFIMRFNLKMDTVSWLCEYDNIAWWTSDSVYATPKEEQSKLGAEWFCFQQQDLWHALYGKFTNGQYQMAYHYTVDTNQSIRRVQESIDTSVSNSFCRALKNGSNFLDKYPDSIKVRFNQYIKRNDDRTISVWFLPAFTTNGIAVWGGEFYYVFDATGNSLISKSEYSQGYEGYKPDRKQEIWLDYAKVDEPTLGAAFFVWYYRTYFDRIVIDAKKFKSTVFHDDQKGYYWVHAKKE